jgi:hypothetical protein
MAEGEVANGSCELPAGSRAHRIAANAVGEIGVEFGANGSEGKGGAVAQEVVFVLVSGAAKFTTGQEISLGRS